MRIERRASRGLVFLGREGGFKLFKLAFPLRFALVKGVWYRAPAGVAGKCLLLVHSCRTPLGLDALERGNGVHVGTEPRLGTALTKMLVGYMEVVRRGRRRFWFGCSANGLKNNVVRQMRFLGVVVRDSVFADFRPSIHCIASP